MDERKYTFLGVFAPVAALVSISLSVSLSPWFSWRSNALSDLGNPLRSGVAPVFNFGLALTGFLTVVYSVAVMVKSARFTGYSLLLSGFMLQLVATFDEVYGSLHYAVSVCLFLSFGSASLAYVLEGRSLLALTGFVVGLSSWALYWLGVYSSGVAVPEAISSASVAAWVSQSALRVILRK